MTRKTKTVTYTDEEVALIHAAARRVWNAIGYDCLKGAGLSSMRRAHVVEVVCDANRLEEELRRSKQTDLVVKVMCDPNIEGIVMGAFDAREYSI